jgi:hypothetical protein
MGRRPGVGIGGETVPRGGATFMSPRHMGIPESSVADP